MSHPFLASSSSLLRQALVYGTPLHALGALYVVASLTVVPLTWISTAYSFSVGYGLSIATMALALLGSFPATRTTTTTTLFALAPSHMVATTALLYGIRLATFIYVREHSVESKKQQFQALNKTPPLKRTPLAMGVSILYVCMISPALFALRAGSTSAIPSGYTTTLGTVGSMSHKIQVVSACVAVFGMILEAIADQHKYQIKRQQQQQQQQHKSKEEAKTFLFVGPTTWSYKLCRHPNYLGEILHWIGLFGVGSVSFGTSPVAWISGVIGLCGILSIMFGASARLDKKQVELYHGQSTFEEWKKTVTSSLIPCFK